MPCDERGLPDTPDITATWSDARLLAAATGVEQDGAALDVLVRRHWRPLLRRCVMLTSDRDRAADLAQDTWTRMLRARAALRAEGSFGAYLATVALNVWRDGRRTDRHQLSLDAPAADGGEEELTIAETLSASASPEHAVLLRLDLDYALSRLPARLRGVVIARYVGGESAAEIGRRYGRTEQTITSWLRDAVTRMQHYLRDWRSAA